MKICPRCQKTYADDNLNFCLEDGTVLTQAGADPLPQTVLLNEPRVTSQSQQSQQYPGQTTSQPAWNTAQQPYAVQQAPQKSSKTWIWVVLILGVVVLLCGGGLVGLFAWVASQADKTAANYQANRSVNTSTTNGTKSTNANTSTSTTTRSNVENIDLKDWVSNQPFGITEFTDGEFFMASRQKGYYYVLAGSKTQQTESANTKVSLRNVDNASSSLGYGIVFHSNPTPLQQGYAFLIDTKTRKYRVVHHEPQKEGAVIPWTKSNAIIEGGQENTIEVRDGKDKIEFYINGELVNSTKNVYGYSGGVVGLYSGDGVKIAFKDLQIAR